MSVRVADALRHEQRLTHRWNSGEATEQIAERSGPAIGGILNATFGNVTELIIGVLLVFAGEFQVVKASLIGSILGNLVLGLGACYLLGGMRHSQQRYDARAARLHASVLLLAVTALVMPAIFVAFSPSETPAQVEFGSLVTAVALISIYVVLIVFTVTRSSRYMMITGLEPRWTARRAAIVLLGAAIAVSVESELLVGSLNPTLAVLHLPKVFVGLFLIAFIGNVASLAPAMVFAVRDKMDVAIEISFGSSTQIALLLAPLLVLVSLLAAHQMDFVFIPVEVGTVTLATLIVSAITMDGRSNWLEGTLLLGVYVIMAAWTLFVS